MTIHKFVSVQFYPAYSAGGKSSCGRYVALDEDGQVFVWAMDGRVWSHLADDATEDDQS
jgi:hypothetical protein